VGWVRGWVREARVGAAREFGARHYRGFAAAEAAGGVGRFMARLVVPVAALAAVGGLVWLAWRGLASAPGALRWAAVVGAGLVAVAIAARLRLLGPAAALAALAGVGWLVWLAVTSWSVGWPWIAGAGLVAVLALKAGRGWRVRYWLATLGR
jgi:hypothetical protein